MTSSTKERERIYKQLCSVIERMGYPSDFANAIAASLGTEKTMSRMLAYLSYAKPQSAEEITDEMLAICEDRDRWRQKKEMEYYNSKYNELLNRGLE